MPYVLANRTITTALSDVTVTEGVSNGGTSQSFIYNLEGITAATLVAQFVYGSSGTSVTVAIDTALGSGGAWLQVATFAFTTASAIKALTLSGLTPRLTALTHSAPGNDAALDGILGDRFRCRVTSVGTYAGNTTLDVRISPR